MARIERSLHDVANVRSLPQSRLRKGAANTFHKIVMQQFPGEFSIDFDCTTAGTVRLVCGVPVFDCQTEEPFGLVCAEAEIGNLVRPELEAVGGQDPVYLIDDHGDILFTSSRETHHKSLPAEQAIEKWPEILKTLLEKPEYLEMRTASTTRRVSRFRRRTTQSTLCSRMLALGKEPRVCLLEDGTTAANLSR